MKIEHIILKVPEVGDEVLNLTTLHERGTISKVDEREGLENPWEKHVEFLEGIYTHPTTARYLIWCSHRRLWVYWGNLEGGVDAIDNED